MQEAGCIGMGRFSCSLLIHQLAVCLYHTWADLPLPSLVSGIENWKENVEQQEGVKCSSFHAQHLAFGDKCGILLWTEGMLWKAAQFEAVSPVYHQRALVARKVDPVTRNSGVNQQGQEQMVKMVKWEAFCEASGKFM